MQFIDANQKRGLSPALACAQEGRKTPSEAPLTPSLQELVAQGILTLEQAREMMPKEENAVLPQPPEDLVDPRLQTFYDRWLSALFCAVKKEEKVNAQLALIIAENICGL